MSQPDAGPNRGSTTGAPRWVKVFGIIFIVLVLVFVILHLTGNSLGGPGSHTPPVEHNVQRP
jgi:ABC-type transporter Mla subunit MlaD